MYNDHKKYKTSKRSIDKLKEVIEQLINVPLFSTFNFNELCVVKKYVRIEQYKMGQNLFKEGDYGDFVGFLISGRLQVIKESKNGKATLMAELSKGRPVGEMSLLDETSRSATVKVVEDSTVVVLTKSNFEQILTNYPRIGIKIFKVLARLVSLNLRKSTSELADFMMDCW